jgi:drug/metabolite transporter (DMT)-like permease
MLLESLISIVAVFILFLEIPSPLTVLGASLLVTADVIMIRNQS